MHRSKANQTSPTPPDADPLSRLLISPEEAAADLWMHRFAIERELLGAILAEPSRGVVDAMQAGCAAESFADLCYGSVYLAAREHVSTGDAQADRESILLAAERKLEESGNWHAGLPAELADVATLYRSYCPAFMPPAVPFYASQLRDVAAQLAELAAVHQRAVEILSRAAGEREAA